MKWIFLSPHLDDAVLSCGGIIHSLTNSRQIVEIWTICAGDPPSSPLSPLAQSLHERWGTGQNAPEVRRREDMVACAALGAKPVYFDFPECIYRYRPGTLKPLIGSNDELFQPLPDSEYPLAQHICEEIDDFITSEDKIVSPTAIGNHIDHHLVRKAALRLNRPLYFYPDYPYTTMVNGTLSKPIEPDWRIIQFNISETNLAAWQAAAAAYQTQVSTFWSSVDGMKVALRTYWDIGGGTQLWFSQSFHG